ncbi:MAG: hypothetical protein IJM15_04430 [Erysipelotrichaceae bacterium]|nr:hypothetical protein [Erysipelotrichaceae bacterium]
MKNKGWFWLLFFMFGGFSLLGDFFELFLGLIFGLIGMAFAAAVVVAPFYGVFKIFQLIFGGGKKSVSQSSARKERKLLKELNKYASKSNIIRLNDEIYLLLEKDPIALNTIAIYIRDEYVSTLQEYKNAFPNAFNNLLDHILTLLKKGVVQDPLFRDETVTAPKKQTTTNTTPKPAPAERILKDASYFIDKFNKLDVIIEDEEISNGLVKCQEYLTQISKIEKEFPETKEKTGKLYQYYLPMLVDILEEYVRLSENASNHKEFTESKQRLAKTIMLINSALESISVTLCQEYYSNMSVDIKTLEALLKKDGYGNELDINALRKENGI